MNWRPRGWENPFEDAKQYELCEFSAFEAGADAMLEALRDEPAVRLSNKLELGQYVIKIKDLPDGVWRVLLLREEDE